MRYRLGSFVERSFFLIKLFTQITQFQIGGWMETIAINPLVIYSITLHMSLCRVMKKSILVDDRSAIRWRSFVFFVNLATDATLNLNRNQHFPQRHFKPFQLISQTRTCLIANSCFVLLINPTRVVSRFYFAKRA